MAVKSSYLGGTNWIDGDILYAVDLLDTIKQVGLYSHPIGSIVGWDKSLTGVPALPGVWVECNGQTLSDADSPLNGQVIPDLNGAVGTGLKGRFLRGHTISGLLESDTFKAHTHGISSGDSPYYNGSGNYSASIHNTNRTNTTQSTGGTETRPANMSVVFIMRVK